MFIDGAFDDFIHAISGFDDGSRMTPKCRNLRLFEKIPAKVDRTCHRGKLATSTAAVFDAKSIGGQHAAVLLTLSAQALSTGR